MYISHSPLLEVLLSDKHPVEEGNPSGEKGKEEENKENKDKESSKGENIILYIYIYIYCIEENKNHNVCLIGRYKLINQREIEFTVTHHYQNCQV